MYAVRLDLELKGRVLEFIHERGCATVDDVRQELFPGEMGVPYLYLDQLTAEGRLLAISEGLEPTQWFSVLGRRERRGTSLRKRRAKDQAKRERQALEVTKAEEPSVDPELLDWVREFIYQRESVSLAGVIQEFFPGDSHTAQRYLSTLESSGAVESPDGGQTYEWAYPDENAAALDSKPQMISHESCTHPNTQAHRAKCRKDQGVPFFVNHQRRGGIYHQFTDGRTHTLNADQVRDLHGGTVAQFASCLRSYASNHALKCSIRPIGSGDGLTFYLGGTREIEFTEYLPSDVVAQDAALVPNRSAPASRQTQTSHAECDHPRTGYERAKCRARRRAAKAAA
ncbi:hypothetical protein ACKI10_40730 [Streptomyces galilaeus]|uniref:hypothetical protein n=1 Tax=Streptomyces galilaeus TaxID=33899 RepID=UPI0038F7742E